MHTCIQLFLSLRPGSWQCAFTTWSSPLWYYYYDGSLKYGKFILYRIKQTDNYVNYSWIVYGKMCISNNFRILINGCRLGIIRSVFIQIVIAWVLHYIVMWSASGFSSFLISWMWLGLTKSTNCMTWDQNWWCVDLLTLSVAEHYGQGKSVRHRRIFDVLLGWCLILEGVELVVGLLRRSYLRRWLFSKVDSCLDG